MIDIDIEKALMPIGAFIFAGLNPDKSNPIVQWISEITAGLLAFF